MHRLFFVLVWLVTSNVFATDIIDLYQVSLPVATQSEGDRLAIAPDALALVLVKVVGDRAALNQTNTTALLNQAADMIQQYQYRYIKKLDDDLTEPEHMEIVLSFNEKAVNQALTELKLPYWDKSRPDVLMWIALDNEGDRAIISADNSNLLLVKTIMDTAAKRGLPIVMPIMDVSDRRQVAFVDIWAGFTQHIIGASRRYGVPVIATVSIDTMLYGDTQVRWQLIIDDKAQYWQSSGDLPAVIQSGIEELTDRVSRHFSHFADGSEVINITLQISNIDNYVDYVRVFSYLSQLTIVSDVRLAHMEFDTLKLMLSLAGDLTLFNRTLDIDKVLVRREQDPITNIIHYSLLP